MQNDDISMQDNFPKVEITKSSINDTFFINGVGPALWSRNNMKWLRKADKLHEVRKKEESYNGGWFSG